MKPKRITSLTILKCFVMAGILITVLIPFLIYEVFEWGCYSYLGGYVLYSARYIERNGVPSIGDLGVVMAMTTFWPMLLIFEWHHITFVENDQK